MSDWILASLQICSSSVDAKSTHGRKLQREIVAEPSRAVRLGRERAAETEIPGNGETVERSFRASYRFLESATSHGFW